MNLTAYSFKIRDNPKIKKIWFGIKVACEKDYIKTILVFSFIFLSFLLTYFSVDRLISLDDHLFYIRFAEIIREKGLSAINDFHWIYFSKISQESMPVYYSFLFYFALIPFTFIKPLILAIKLYGVVFFALSFTILYYFLLKAGAKRPFLWTIIPLAIVNIGGLNRFLSARPFTLAPALLLLELYFLYKRKYWGIFLISLTYFYWHNTTFIFTLLIPVFFVLFENFYGKKIDLKPILVSIAAIIIDLFIAISFTPGLSYIYSMVFGIYRDTIIGKTINIGEGMEHYPIDFFDYLRFNTLTIVLFTIAVIVEIYQYIEIRFKQKGELTLFGEKQPLKSTLFFLSLIFFLGNFLTQRNNDFFIFFSSAYIALSFEEIAHYVNVKKELIKKSIMIAVYAISGYLLIGNLLFMQNQVASVRPYNTIQEAAEWLKNNTEKKEIIFHPTWNWFPALFYYNQDNYYIAGLAARFLYDYDHEIYWAWFNISNRGLLCTEENCDGLIKRQQYYLRDEERSKIWYEKEGNAIADYIKNNFHSRFVLTSRDFSIFNAVMDNNKRFEKVFTDKIYNEFYIYKIK